MPQLNEFLKSRAGSGTICFLRVLVDDGKSSSWAERKGLVGHIDCKDGRLVEFPITCTVLYCTLLCGFLWMSTSLDNLFSGVV